MELRHLKELARRHKVRTEAFEASRVELAEAIRETAAEGYRQVDIVEATGYTREQIRRIAAGRTR